MVEPVKIALVQGSALGKGDPFKTMPLIGLLLVWTNLNNPATNRGR